MEFVEDDVWSRGAGFGDLERKIEIHSSRYGH